MKDDQTSEGSTREAVGIFLEAGKLAQAVVELEGAGVQGNRLGIMARDNVVREKLGHIYEQSRQLDYDTPGEEAVFVRKESGDVTVKGLTGGLYFAGGTAAMGAVVVSAAILGGPVAVAISGALAVGMVGTLVGNMIHKSDTEFLREQLDEGHVLLFVPLPDHSRGEQIRQILGRHSPIDVKVYEVPAN